MSEKSITVGDNSTGSPVALRTAVELGDGDATRYVQVTDVAARQFPFIKVSDTVTLETDITNRTWTKRNVTNATADQYDISSVIDGTDDIVDSIIRVKDASNVILWGSILQDDGTGHNADVVIVPFIAAVIDAGPPMSFGMVAPLKPIRVVPISPLNNYGASGMPYSYGWFPFAVESLPTCGAEYMGFGVYISDTIQYINVWMAQSSFGGRNAYWDQLAASGEWGGDSWPFIA